MIQNTQNEMRESQIKESSRFVKSKMNFQKPLKTLLTMDVSKIDDKKLTYQKFTSNSKIFAKKASNENKKTAILFSKKSNNGVTKKKIMPLTVNDKTKTQLIEVKREDNLFPERSLYFFNYGKKRFIEFSKQLVQKHAFIEKIMLFTLFFFSIFQNFLILGLIDFFDMIHFLILELMFIVFLGFILFFIREFYQKIYKKQILKFLLFKIFLMGLLSKFLELVNSNIEETYSLLFMNMVILYLIMSNIW